MRCDCLVSVIIPVYNVRPFLKESIESVLNQTYKNLEIIMIDDGSTDGSGDICDSFAAIDRRIKILHQTKNMGLSTARNAGLDLMTGEIVAFLDSDDAYHPNYISAMMDVMNNERPDIVICRYSIHNTEKKMELTGCEIIEPQALHGKYSRCLALQALAEGTININVWNKLYRSELWKDIRFPDGCVYEDISTVFQVINLCKCVYILDVPLYRYRIHSNSISNTWSKQKILDKMNALSQFDSFIEMNTPEVFTKEQLKRRKRDQLKWIMSLYIRYSQKAMEDGKTLGEDFRQMILGRGRLIGIESCTLNVRTAYRFISHLPWLLRFVYPIYHVLHLLTFSFIDGYRTKYGLILFLERT